MDKFEILTVNARGLNSDEKRTKLYAWLHDIQTDIIFVQETHYIEKDVLKYDARWLGKSYHCFSDSKFSRGVSILFKKELDVELIEKHGSIDGRRLFLKVKINGIELTLVNVYAPNSAKYRNDFFIKLNSFLHKRCVVDLDNIIMCGDFNCKTNNPQDQSSNKLNKIVSSLEMYDIWHTEYPDLDGYTWCNADNVPSSRIDYTFVSRNFIYDFEKITLRKIPGTINGKRMSDHRLLKTSFKTNINKRGNGYWKLNNSYLSDENYQKGIQTLINEIKYEENTNPMVKWESFKARAREFSINFAKNSKESIKQRILSLEKEIDDIEKLEFHHIDMTKKRNLEAELDKIYDIKCKGAFVRSRSKWMLEGEKSSKYFFNLEKSRQKQSIIKELKTDNGTFNKTNDIMGVMCDFYEKLYSSNKVSDNCIDEYLSSVEIYNELSENDANFCGLS